MMQPLKLNNGSVSDYGLGFELMNSSDMELAGNNGAGLGYNTTNLQFLNDGLTIIVLTNTTNSNSTMIAKNIRDILMNNVNDKPQSSLDKLDSLVIHIFSDVQKETLSQQCFKDTIALTNFKKNNYTFIKSQGNLITLEKQGEKINPQSIVRRYLANFEKGKIGWVIIFSNDGKIIIANHM
jgi:hypothetical protein